MKKLLVTLPLSLLLVVAQTASADGFGIRFSDDAFAMSYNIYPIAEHSSAEFAWVHNDDDNYDVASAGFFVNGQQDRLSGRAGVKGYYAKIDKDDGWGAAVGGDLAFQLTKIALLVGRGYWGPGSVSFSDIKCYEEWALGVNVTVFENAMISATYGSLELRTETYNYVDVDDGFSLGLKMNF